ncbi:hypothetical protein F5Y14DRAFT_270177 [Nemania sp. NC0429]|nr:hypothetical protein F5Y14DRAFT_270177 [Nemania sp. NC0429]
MYARGPLRTLQLAAVFALASAASLPANPPSLFERDDGTCAAGFNKCSEAGLPDSFCCPAKSTCNVLAGATTVLCCPSGSNCATIKTISCNTSLQDPAKDPTAALKTTELGQKLPTCGNGCCPFGYHCDGGSNNCVMDADQSKKPGEASSVPSPSSSVNPTSTAKPTSTPASSSAPKPTSSSSTTTAAAGGATSSAAQNEGETETPAPPSSSTAARTLNTAAIVGGVVGGLLGISLITAGICLLRHRRKKNGGASSSEKHKSGQSIGHMISAPMPHADYYNQRLDFLAKAQSTSVSSTPTAAQPHSNSHQQQAPYPPDSPYSPSQRNSGTTDYPRSHHASAEVGGLRNLTDRYSGGSNTFYSSSQPPQVPLSVLQTLPEMTAQQYQQQQHQQGGERMHSINVFADPETVGTPSDYNRRDTTWTDLQHHADRNDSGSDTEPPMPRR